MASLLRVGRQLARRSCVVDHIKPVGQFMQISTSKKNEETATAAEKLPTAVDEIAQAAAGAKKKWVSYGFSKTDQYEDVASAHLIFFFGLTIAIVVGSFAYCYAPDRTLKDWAQREAYLELRRREALGLPLVDPNYVGLSSIELLSEEELGEAELII